VASLALAALAASASAGAARPPVALIASPPHLALTGRSAGIVLVTNTGTRAVVVDVTRAGFALDLRGRPRVVAGRRRWLSVRPKRLALAPGASTPVAVRSVVPRGAEPGDHTALVLMTTRPSSLDTLAVRVRLGVVVAVRVPGKVVRRVRVLRVRVTHGRTLRLLVANRGNVTEKPVRGCLRLTLRRHRRLVARLRPLVHELLPRTAGLVELRYRIRKHGPLVVHVLPTRRSARCAPIRGEVFHVSV
jgi:hypothetical protein